MSLSPEHLKQILSDADHPLGIKELLRLAGLHPGQQTELKRTLRELVRQGDILKDGKRFVPRQPTRRDADVRVKEQGAPDAWRQRGVEGPREGGPNRGPQQAGPRAAGPGGFAGRRPEPGARGKRAGWQERGPGSDRRGASKHGGGFRQERAQWPGRRGSAASEAEGDGLLEGILHVHRDGFGFVHPLSAEGGDNVFLPPHEAQRALDNDRVVVAVSGRPPRLEGRIIRVVQRRRELAVGTYVVKGRYAVVYPTDSSLPGPIRVPLTQMAREGDLVKVQLGIGAQMLDPDRGLHGEVAGSLGKPGTPSSEVLGVAYSQGFSDEFPPEVMGEADRYAVTVSEEEARGEHRRDLRAMPLITIDGEDARDFDDAVYVEERADGWRLVVAIADVTHYVWEGSALNTEALRRATSVYLPDRVLPMLPERLSNGICSLRPDEDRLCMVADLTFDRRGHRRSYDLYPAVMRSVARCTYNEVQDVLDGKDVPHRNAHKPHFERLMSLARALMKMRKERGAIDFDLPEHKVVLDEEGLPARMDKRERKDSHRLIEECMLAANEAVATFFQDEGLPTVYRFHGEPDPEKLATFAALAEAYGFKMRVEDGVSSKELDAFVSQLQGHPEQRALNQLLLRSMMQAVYTSSRVGHYGLAAEHYLHFTSPIRRYPDLLVHRLLKAHWARKGRKPTPSMLEREEDQLEDMSAQCSERERAAMQVEREVVSFYACLLMKDRVGEEFAATVAAITDFGFFVELDEVHVEGLVKAETLGPGAKLDKLTHSLVYANGRRVRVGQKLRVRLTSVNVTAKKIDFEALQFEGEALLTRVATRGEQPQRRRAWTAEAPPHRERDERRERAGRPGRREHEAAAGRSGPAPQEPREETGAGRPRGRFSREGRREEAAPHRKEPRFPPRAPEGQAPPRSESPAWPKRRTFIRPEPQAPAPVSAETAEPLPPEAPPAPAPWDVPTGDDAAQSPHPGFDRIRALASQRQPGPEARGASHGRSFQKQKPRGGPGPRFPAPKPRSEPEDDKAFSMEPPRPAQPEAPVEAPERAHDKPVTAAPPQTTPEPIRAAPVAVDTPAPAEAASAVAAPKRKATRKKAVVKAARPPARKKTPAGSAGKATAKKAEKPKKATAKAKKAVPARAAKATKVVASKPKAKAKAPSKKAAKPSVARAAKSAKASGTAAKKKTPSGRKKR
ncbi:ribonuclease R [Myxococcus sp. SDU36]|uniref:ribonuclease R n=1 Tax=Myxococcus sp. SDU36 TaxID=2831967 RepID=UPI0025436CDE|nr:ribonuclease R [Myxococcus sp. SDU36]WIG97707.1 ribonuclease R [Myxococcus sp. SDU36]